MDTINEDPKREIILDVKFIKGSEPILIEDEKNRVRDNYYSHILILRIILYYDSL